MVLAHFAGLFERAAVAALAAAAEAVDTGYFAAGNLYTAESAEDTAAAVAADLGSL